MIKSISRSQLKYATQALLFLFVNSLFILKYLQRATINSGIFLSFYVILIVSLFFIYNRFSFRIKESVYKVLTLISSTIVVALIATLLIKIDPLSVRVDRWSAVAYFLESLFRGDYPYATHTHVSETNFASPFPVWHALNIPFYFMGDVGIGLIVFFIATIISVHLFAGSYRKTFFFILLLTLSPAYWWEVAVRSDSLSNAILVFVLILWYFRKNYTLHNNFVLSIILCGCVASTRLSAILPLALFFFSDYIKLDWRKIILFPTTILLFGVITFLPFILWDTENWIFFSRNPFMSQTSVGNIYFLLAMTALGIFTSLKWKSRNDFLFATSLLIFIFILGSQLSLIITKGINESIFQDSTYDISYFTLIFPYCIAYLSNQVSNPSNSSESTSYLSNS